MLCVEKRLIRSGVFEKEGLAYSLKEAVYNRNVSAMPVLGITYSESVGLYTSIWILGQVLMIDVYVFLYYRPIIFCVLRISHVLIHVFNF